MCFSAEASFTVGTILGVIGVATLKQVHHWSRLLISLIPLLFAIQQIMEGIIWVHMDGEFISTPFSETIVYLYLFFAWVLWPVYIPITFLLSEKVPWKRYTCIICLLIGIVLTANNMQALFSEEIILSILGNSLFYGSSPAYDNMLYGIAIILPIFISSIPGMWVFGAGLLITFIVSQIIYALTFTSVWCFFCAAVSILLFRILKKEEYQWFPQ